MKETTDNIAKYCGLGGLMMKAKKTEPWLMEGYVAAPTPREYRTIDITVDVNSAEQVTQFTYLGAKTTLDCKLDYEIGLRSNWSF